MNNEFTLSPVVRDLPLALIEYAQNTQRGYLPCGGYLTREEKHKRTAIADRIYMAMSFADKKATGNHINRLENIAA